MRPVLILLASTALVSCVGTVLETSGDHPANAAVHPAAPEKPAEALKPGFDPFEAYPDEARAKPEPTGADSAHPAH
jgi:hypothetical protein